jgi:3-methyladenine DNA glycosylase AlkD
MTVEQTMAELEALGNEPMRGYNAKSGVGDNQFGVKMGDIRVLAKKIKSDHPLALNLWKTGNLEARLLATLILKPRELSETEVDRMVRDVPHPPHMAPSQLADWLMSYVIKTLPWKEDMRQKWMDDSDPMAARAGWSLTVERIVKSPVGLDLSALLDRIEREMPGAPPAAQWTMNFCLGEIGINFAKHRERALAIGETLGLYRDYPCSKGCTSPFVPIWIAEMVKRQDSAV